MCRRMHCGQKVNSYMLDPTTQMYPTTGEACGHQHGHLMSCRQAFRGYRASRLSTPMPDGCSQSQPPTHLLPGRTGLSSEEPLSSPFTDPFREPTSFPINSKSLPMWRESTLLLRAQCSALSCLHHKSLPFSLFFHILSQEDPLDPTPESAQVHSPSGGPSILI